MQLSCAAMFSVRNSGGWNRGDTGDTDFDIDTDAEAKTNTNTRLRKPSKFCEFYRVGRIGMTLEMIKNMGWWWWWWWSWWSWWLWWWW